MKFSPAVLLLALSALATALPAEEVVQEEVAREEPVSDSVVGNCRAGHFKCASVFSGGHRICKNCAIVTGNAEGKCVSSASCARHNGSCKDNHGNPFCV